MQAVPKSQSLRMQGRGPGAEAAGGTQVEQAMSKPMSLREGKAVQSRKHAKGRHVTCRWRSTEQNADGGGAVNGCSSFTCL